MWFGGGLSCICVCVLYNRPSVSPWRGPPVRSSFANAVYARVYIRYARVCASLLDMTYTHTSRIVKYNTVYVPPYIYM